MSLEASPGPEDPSPVPATPTPPPCLQASVLELTEELGNVCHSFLDLGQQRGNEEVDPEGSPAPPHFPDPATYFLVPSFQ